MRIARISTIPYFVVSQLAKQLEFISLSGALVTVISSDGKELAKLKAAVPTLRFISVEIARPISLIKDIKAFISLILIFRRERFDIIHSTTPKAGLLSAVAGKLVGVPVRIHTFTGQPWLNLAGPVRWLARWSDWLIGKLNTRCYTDSESQRMFLIEQGIIAPGQLFVIGAGSLAGVNLDRFNAARFSAQDRMALRCELSIPDEAPVLLFVGRITLEKGTHELIDTFRNMKAAGSPAHLVFVGPFDHEDIEHDKFSRGDIDAIPDTHIVGYTEAPEAYMAIADILCLPSYREGFGTVVIEAAAMGLPTVGSNIYGLSDAVISGETGILVPLHDVAALEAALSTLLNDEKLRLKMGYAARQRSKALFRSELVNGRLMGDYNNLLQAVKKQDC